MSEDRYAKLDEYRAESLKLRSVLYDRTTGLRAFPVLFDSLRSLLDRRRRLGVIHVELTNLELVESLYGWQVFDRIVSRASTALRESVGSVLPGGALLGINGVAGDRFVAFVTAEGGSDVDPVFLARMADGIRPVIESVLGEEEFAGLGPDLAVRTGYAVLADDPFYRFERRVYAAVAEARNRGERRVRRRETSWTAELRRIIRDATVSTVFQPVVDLDSREVLGFEALVRGPRDSVFEMPRPMFALSSRAGVEADLDRLCRATALRELATLGARGKVFLNVLPASLADPAWHGEGMRQALRDASMGPGDLVVEVSERRADAGLERAAAEMDDLRSHGFGVALDDVGTGYSTLATLERIRPDFLKVDASLVRGVDRHLIKQDLIASLVQAASRLGASVIAEGVESEQEEAAVRRAGVRYAQGFFFSRPVSPVPDG